MTMFKGYLTYTLAAIAVAGAGAGYLLGILDAEHALTMAYAGLALFGIRRAIN